PHHVHLAPRRVAHPAPLFVAMHRLSATRPPPLAHIPSFPTRRSSDLAPLPCRQVTITRLPGARAPAPLRPPRRAPTAGPQCDRCRARRRNPLPPFPDGRSVARAGAPDAPASPRSRGSPCRNSPPRGPRRPDRPPRRRPGPRTPDARAPCRTGWLCSRRYGSRRSRPHGQPHEHGPHALGEDPPATLQPLDAQVDERTALGERPTRSRRRRELRRRLGPPPER